MHVDQASPHVDLIPITDTARLRAIGCHLAPATLRKLSSTGARPRLLVTICRRILLDATEWRKIIAEAVADRDRRAERIEKQRIKTDDPSKPRRGRPRKIVLPAVATSSEEPKAEAAA